MKVIFKPNDTIIVRLCYRGEIVATIPVVSESDLSAVKEILARYVATVDDAENYYLQITTSAQVKKSLL